MSLPCCTLSSIFNSFLLYVYHFGLTRKDSSESYPCCVNGPKFLKVQIFELIGYIVSPFHIFHYKMFLSRETRMFQVMEAAFSREGIASFCVLNSLMETR